MARLLQHRDALGYMLEQGQGLAFSPDMWGDQLANACIERFFTEPLCPGSTAAARGDMLIWLASGSDTFKSALLLHKVNISLTHQNKDIMLAFPPYAWGCEQVDTLINPTHGSLQKVVLAWLLNGSESSQRDTHLECVRHISKCPQPRTLQVFTRAQAVSGVSHTQ